MTTLLVSAAVATILIYPIPYLFTNDLVNGASNLPHHVWTVAQPLPYQTAAESDVVMRSAWVHSSYMQALNKDLLAAALDIQDELLGATKDFRPKRVEGEAPLVESMDIDMSPSQRDAFHVINGLTDQAWFFQSPLQYWGNSKELILADDDVLATVNDRKNMSTVVNVTLRHSMVFSGKRFEDRRILAADALVITLFHLRDSPVGKQWERKAAELAQNAGGRWTVYPPDGRISTSRLYEFQFRPISTEDTLTLALAYGLAIGYFLMSLSKLRAVKSKFGLMVTVVTQIVFAIMSSFTVCATFNVDLSRIPRAAYPLVILAMSLENIFRLINAVLSCPAEDSTSNRIGQAFGGTAPVAIASVMQNVLILSILSHLVSPGVSGFCIFLAVAIVFDVFYLSTFFLAVLSVDVRRTELSDALAKAPIHQHRHYKKDPRRQQIWIEKVLHGNVALSTRIAGTVVMVGFILISHWHFYEDETVLNTTIALFQDLDPLRGTWFSKPSMLDEVHQARSPSSWLRLQDHESAREIINVINPSGHSYIAQVFEPIVFVLDGSNRTPHSREPALLPAAYDFINHQLTQFIVIVVVIVSALRLLISYLLWEDEANIEEERLAEETPLLTIKSLPAEHILDIAMLATSAEGHLISAGLDRQIRIWDIRSGEPCYSIPIRDDHGDDIFPVRALATSEDSQWLAILTDFRVALWSLSSKNWGPSIPVDTCGQKPQALFFTSVDAQGLPELILVRKNGTVVELAVDQVPGGDDFSICKMPLVSTEPVIIKASAQSPAHIYIVTASKTGCVHVATSAGERWVSPHLHHDYLEHHKVHQVIGLGQLGLFLVATSTRVFIVGLDDHEVLHAFTTEPMKERSLRCTFQCARTNTDQAIGVIYLTLAYVSAESGDCILQNYTPTEDANLILARSSSGASEGCNWGSARQTRKYIANPGHFVILSDGSVAGVRRKAAPPPQSYPVDGLRKRFGTWNVDSSADPWDVWTAAPLGRAIEDEEQHLFQDGEQQSKLLVTSIGPITKLGQMSTAFGFGNVIKLVTVGGHERFEVPGKDNGHDSLLVGSRRRKTGASRGRAST